MSTTPEQKKLILKAIKLHLEDNGITCNWVHDENEEMFQVKGGKCFMMGISEFSGSKWDCTGACYHIPRYTVQLNAPDSMNKLVLVAKACAKESFCTECPMVTGDFSPLKA